MQKFADRMRKIWEWICAAARYLNSIPGRLEQDSRNRERRKLVEELADLDKLREYCKAREPGIVGRLNALDALDLAAAMPASRYGNRWNHTTDAAGYFRLQAFKKGAPQ